MDDITPLKLLPEPQPWFSLEPEIKGVWTGRNFILLGYRTLLVPI